MSPEQLMGKQLDGRSDVYAMGVLTYELITARLPFPDAKGPAQLITAQLKQTPMAPSQANPAGAIPPGVDACIARMLEKDKNNRFADVAGLRIEVERLLASDGQLAAGSAPQPAAMPAPAPAPARPLTPAPAQPYQYQPPAVAPMGRPSTHSGGPSTATAVAAARGSRMWLWLALAIVAIGGAVGAIIALTSG
jgi:serine/threonine-protein kinase